jgi:hypothetical protein
LACKVSKFSFTQKLAAYRDQNLSILFLMLDILQENENLWFESFRANMALVLVFWVPFRLWALTSNVQTPHRRRSLTLRFSLTRLLHLALSFWTRLDRSRLMLSFSTMRLLHLALSV